MTNKSTHPPNGLGKVTSIFYPLRPDFRGKTGPLMIKQLEYTSHEKSENPNSSGKLKTFKKADRSKNGARCIKSVEHKDNSLVWNL